MLVRRTWGPAAGVAVLSLAVACGLPTATSAPAVTGAAVDPPTGAPPDDPPVERPAPDPTNVEALVAGLNDVGYRIFAAAAGASPDDVVLSPLSIGLAFGMADLGATGPTADTLAALFAYPVDGEERWAAFNALEQAVVSDAGPIVRLANRQFPDVSFQPAPEYDERLQRWFGTGIEPLPLAADPDASRERINRWVAQRTEDRIPELLRDAPDAAMVLVNALYLEADWLVPFGKYPTMIEDFTRLDGSTVPVALMHELELLGPAVATDSYAATEVPYEGKELSMLVIVPEDGHFADVQARLAEGLAAEIDATATPAAVELYLPTFQSTATLDLREVLEGNLGVTDLFDVPGFAGIAPEVELGSAVHAADLEVDEQGTVAAAATALEFPTSGPPVPDLTVRADRPFLYLIRHQPTGMVLFVGRVMDPAA